jgi:succinate-semialdehyde dehydrogenase / glutarate-semialdehyde dehydrogenase
MERGLYLSGRWVQASGAGTVEVTDPATGEIVGRSALAGVADVDAAVESARVAFQEWRRMHPDERAAILLRGARLIEERVDEIARTLTLEQGKPLADSRKEILFGATVLRYYAEEGRRLGGAVRPSSRSDVRSMVTWEPVGVVGAIVPWNYPVDLYCWKIGPALAAGNSVVAKPPVEAPLAVGLVVQCMHDAGLPAGVLNDIPGGLEAGQRMSTHPGIDMITATASTSTGQNIMRSAATTMKRLSLELGGQSPFIVLDDADIEEAAEAATRRSFSNTGQICIAVNRILVADSLADDFVAAVADHASRITLGHGLDAGVTCGPAAHPSVIATAQRHVADAVERGARLVHGGTVASPSGLEAGRFFVPTVLDDVPLQARSMNEETFGPVVAVHRYSPSDDVVEIANRSDFGLAAYVYGRDLDRAWAVAEELNVGGVGVNINDVTELQAPFGGWKMSGFGRELGVEGLHGFSQQRHVRLRRSHSHGRNH